MLFVRPSTHKSKGSVITTLFLLRGPFGFQPISSAATPVDIHFLYLFVQVQMARDKGMNIVIVYWLEGRVLGWEGFGRVYLESWECGDQEKVRKKRRTFGGYFELTIRFLKQLFKALFFPQIRLRTTSKFPDPKMHHLRILYPANKIFSYLPKKHFSQDTVLASGSDRILVRVLKEFLPKKKKSLSSSGKHAMVRSTLKKGDLSNPDNRRPITLILRMSLNFLISYILKHLESHILLSDHLCGFRKAGSTDDIHSLCYLCVVILS